MRWRMRSKPVYLVWRRRARRYHATSVVAVPSVVLLLRQIHKVNPHGDDDREERIRIRAYALWQIADCQEGVALDHWIRPQQNVDGELT